MVTSDCYIYYYLPVEFVKINSTFDITVSNSLTLVTPHLYLTGLPLLVKQTQTKVTMIKLGVAKLKGTTFIFIC